MNDNKRTPTSINKKNLLELTASLFWMAVGIFFGIVATKLGLGKLSAPGPGFVPLIMAVLLIILSYFTFPKALHGSVGPIQKIFWHRQIITIVIVLIFSLLLSRIGFLLSTFVLVFLLLSLLAGNTRKWPRVFLYAVIIALCAWLVFSVALKLPFPTPRLWGIRI